VITDTDPLNYILVKWDPTDHAKQPVTDWEEFGCWI